MRAMPHLNVLTPCSKAGAQGIIPLLQCQDLACALVQGCTKTRQLQRQAVPLHKPLLPLLHMQAPFRPGLKTAIAV